MAYDAQGNWTAPRNADDRSRIYTDEEYALQRQRLQEQLAGMGIQLPPPDPNAPPPSRVRIDESRATEPWTGVGNMHNPGWGIERPGDAGGGLPGGGQAWGSWDPVRQGNPIAPLPPAQSGTFPTHDAAGRAPGDPQWGTLGGAAGMGQPSTVQQIMAGRGGGNAFGGAIGGLFGGGGRAGNTLTGGLMGGSGQALPGAFAGGYGQAPGAALSGYGGGRQSPTPYGMGRPSPTPYQGSGYSTLGGISGYGRRY